MGIKKTIGNIGNLVRLMAFGMPANAVGSIDATKRCNLRCEHCYFFAEEHKERELTVEEWTARLDAMKAAGDPMLLCTWVGGEPLVRKPLIEIGRRYFKHNTVVTNGTMELPDWDDVTWVISIDGTEEAFAKMRAPGIYEKIKDNVRRHSNLRIQISCVLTSLTMDCVEDLIIEWGDLARAGIIFDFFTPVSKLDESLWINWEDRDLLIDKLLDLKKKYPGKINMLDSTLDLMRSKNARRVTDNCLFREKAFTLGADGNPKGKCMMGNGADCDRCGCVVPFYMATMNNPRLLVKEAVKKAFGSR